MKTMHGGSASRGRHVMLGILIVGAIFVAPRVASAATMFLSPAAGQFGVGQTFSITVRLNSQGIAVNAAEGVLSFNPAFLQVVSISSAGTVINLNVQDPEFSNTLGAVRWAGIILNPGFTGASGNLFTINFKAVAPGQGAVNFVSGAVLANDGQGTNVLNGMTGAVYGIGTAITSPTPTPTGPVLPVSSSTHPNSTQWYSNNDPQFMWELPSDTTGVSYSINTRATADPGNQPDGLVKTIQFTDVPNGASYFHIKFFRRGAWSPITHFRFNTDIEPPATYALTRTDSDDAPNPQPRVAFVARDTVSGIVKYLMRIGEGEWFEVPESPVHRPYALPLLTPGTYEVLVEAVDRANNSTRAVLAVVVESITPPTIAQYPDQVDADTPFMISGRSDPGTTVRVNVFRTSGPFGRFFFGEEMVATVDAATDSTGQWFAQIPAFPGGVYRLQANAIDGRGAVSNASDSVSVHVGYSFLERIWDFLRLLFRKDVLPILALLAILLCLWILFPAWWRRRRRATSVRVAPTRADKKVSDHLASITRDMDEEIALLGGIAKNRPLYPEEKYLRSKLLAYSRAMKTVLSDTHRRLAKKK